MSQHTTVFSWPKEAIFGSDVSGELGRYAAKNKMRKALVLLDEGVRQAGLARPVTNSLIKARIDSTGLRQIAAPHLL